MGEKLAHTSTSSSARMPWYPSEGDIAQGASSAKSERRRRDCQVWFPGGQSRLEILSDDPPRSMDPSAFPDEREQERGGKVGKERDKEDHVALVHVPKSSR